MRTLTVFLSLLFFSVAVINAQPNEQGPPDEPRLTEIIPDLTEEQSDQITEFRNNMLENTTPLQADLKVKRAELEVLMTSDSEISEKEAKLKEISDLQYEVQLERIKFHHNVRDILTDEQKPVFDKWTLKRGKGPKGKKGGRKNRPMKQRNNRNR